jgi:hypothetical protein
MSMYRPKQKCFLPEKVSGAEAGIFLGMSKLEAPTLILVGAEVASLRMIRSSFSVDYISLSDGMKVLPLLLNLRANCCQHAVPGAIAFKHCAAVVLRHLRAKAWWLRSGADIGGHGDPPGRGPDTGAGVGLETS